MTIQSGFADSVEDELGEVFADSGFELVASSDVRATYQRDDRLVSVAHLPEEFPGHIYVDVGLRTDAEDHLVGLWRILSETSELGKYTTWTFGDTAELRELLQRLASEILPGALLLVASEDLETHAAQQRDEAESRYLEDQRSADLIQARRAFADGRLREAIDRWVLLGDEALSARDRRQLYEARRQLPDGGGHDS